MISSVLANDAHQSRSVELGICQLLNYPSEIVYRIFTAFAIEYAVMSENSVDAEIVRFSTCWVFIVVQLTETVVFDGLEYYAINCPNKKKRGTIALYQDIRGARRVS